MARLGWERGNAREHWEANGSPRKVAATRTLRPWLAAIHTGKLSKNLRSLDALDWFGLFLKNTDYVLEGPLKVGVTCKNVHIAPAGRGNDENSKEKKLR